MNTVVVTNNNNTVVDSSTGQTVVIPNEVVSIVSAAVQGPTGATGAAGEAITLTEFVATAAQTNFSIAAAATELKAFFVNGISYLEDVEINPPSSGTVVYSGGYTLESGDSIVIGHIE